MTVPVEVAPAARAGSARLPVSSRSALETVWSSERRYRVVEAAAGTVPRLAVLSVTSKLCPGSISSGGSVTLVAARSGLAIAIRVAEPRQLFVSLASGTTPAPSAQAPR